MSQNTAVSPLIVGGYSQHYNDIVKPDQIWPVSKYFLRRWTPYLNPTRFWTIIAARQLAYRFGNKRRFECYDKSLYKEACTSRANFYRIKAELGEKNTPLSLFISRAPIKYQRRGDVTKPGPTVYHVRLDDVLTPADATYLTTWFQSQNIKHQETAVLALLQQALDSPAADFLAPSLTPSLNDPATQFQPITIADVIERVYGSKIAQKTEVRQAAEALHTHLTGSTYIGSQYFRKEWVKRLGPGPAFLLTYLRSQCYFREESGEQRNEVTFTKPQLADALGIDKVTLFRWLKKIDSKTPKNQLFFPFLELIRSHKTAVNEVETTYRVQLYDPLTEPDLELYLQAISVKSTETVVSKPVLQNETHAHSQQPKLALQNETHSTSKTTTASLQNETHTHTKAMDLHSFNLQNETHILRRDAKLDPHPVATLQNETVGIAKWDTYKYLTTLIKALTNKEISTLAAAGISLPENLIHAFWQTAVSDTDHFCQLVNIQGRRGREIIRQSDLTLDQLVAWVLYAKTQNGITVQMLSGYLINRAREQEAPPKEFIQLAHLSLELWLCYSSLPHLPPKHHDHFDHTPVYNIWMRHYSQIKLEKLPFGVGGIVQDWLSSMSVMTQANDPVIQAHVTQARPYSPEIQTEVQTIVQQKDESIASQQWQTALYELEMQMTKATFNTLLKDTYLLHHEGQSYTVGVQTEQAQAWLTHRLYPTIERTFSAITQDVVTLKFEHIA